MARVSYDSLQWQTAITTFTSIMIAGLVSIAISAAAFYYQTFDLGIPEIELILYHSLAAASLLILSLLFSARTYLTLSRPLDNLMQITKTLPLLSSKQYDEAKSQLLHIAHYSEHHEINALQYASFQLANLLEQLDSDMVSRTRSINTKNSELQTERDFVKGLVNTAQLIIITVNDQFDITLFNHHGEKVTGLQAESLLLTSVARMFPAGNWTETQSLFKELLAGTMPIAQQDAELIDHAGHIKHISWLHSPIAIDGEKMSILSVGMDMTEKKEADRRIVWLAEHDPLTDLYNRRRFTEEFEKSLRTAIRYKHKNTLLFLDLDQFKDINDTSGHRAGDELLQLVATTLIRVTRFTDLVARLGGDEFAILMPESNAEGAEILAKKIIQELAKIQLQYGQAKHKVSTSIGIVHYPLLDADIHELMGFADLAMYKAKAGGRGRFHTFSTDDDTQNQLESRVYWKQRIEQALEQDNFVLYFQPILDIQSASVKHYEVLIRMHDPETGDISLPGKFIEVAEQIGLITRIDHYVIHRAINKLAELQKAGADVSFSINLSGTIADDPLLIPMLKRFIARSGVKPESLIFEITETAAVSNIQQAKEMMVAIKSLGCQFALDDFGVGFGSFNYMRELPVDIIKIDGIFIKDLDKNADDQLFVKALCDVAKGMGKKTTAEYVENAEILALLKEFGVDHAQGFYIGHPRDQTEYTQEWGLEESEELLSIN
jgi:diguanylate cyclase (GGDEF)-like protein/PAS domain S-box-containing protein